MDTPAGMTVRVSPQNARRKPHARSTARQGTGIANRRLRLALTCSLAISALLYCGYHVAIALHPDDTNHLETPLVLAAARPLVAGAQAIYGPYSSTNALVLIHAPLYYRLTELCAWPLSRIGLDPTLACLAAGRAISFVGLLLAMGAAARLVRLDGAGSRVAMLWAALAVASSPVFGSFPVTVRPDTLAIALQSWAVVLVLEGLRDNRARATIAGWVLIGLSLAMKQHCLATPAVLAVLTLAPIAQALRARQRVDQRQVVSTLAGFAAALLVVILLWFSEQAITAGRMRESVVDLPARLRQIAMADWSHVVAVAWEVGKRSIGLEALALGAILVAPRRTLRFQRLDWTLLGLLFCELALAAVLCKLSTGAWANYAMQAIVFAAALLARALDRALALPLSKPRQLGLAATILVLPLADARLVAISAQTRSEEHRAIRALLDDPVVASTLADERYFVGYPQHNRRFGNVALAHDEWLYEAFESIEAAEPRDRWLRNAVTQGPVRLVVVPHDGKRDPLFVPGVADPLPALGYREEPTTHGRYHVWTRESPASR
jgi:hypothetical protein